jgi:CBS domain-containing protein
VVTEADGTLHGVVSYRDLVSDGASGRPELSTEEVVRGDAVILPVDASLREAVELMKAKRIGCVPLCDASRQPVGIVTRRDVLRAVAG